MGAEGGLSLGAKLLITIGIISSAFAIYKLGQSMVNKGLNQAANMTAEFDDIDKQKYAGMSILGSEVESVISNYFKDSTCEVAVCTMDGVNAVYNMASSDSTYAVPFTDELSGMPTADCLGRTFSEKCVENGNNLPHTTTIDGVSCVDAKAVSSYDGSTNGALLVNAAEIASAGKILATANGYNSLIPLGSGGYISQTAVFVGSVQKDINGSIRRITFVQRQ